MKKLLCRDTLRNNNQRNGKIDAITQQLILDNLELPCVYHLSNRELQESSNRMDDPQLIREKNAIRKAHGARPISGFAANLEYGLERSLFLISYWIRRDKRQLSDI